MEDNLKNFYIADEQSIYLLSANDARKIRNWVELCKRQLRKMGYKDVELIGKGAYGFVFVGVTKHNKERVFKFSRITLPQNVRERLEEEGYMLGLLKHRHIPRFLTYQSVKKQGILVMQRGKGMDLHELLKLKGRLPVATIVKIGVQLADILQYLRQVRHLAANGESHIKPIVHGDIKPSNLVWDEEEEKLSLIDWGSCVFAQLDKDGQPIANNVMELMSADMQNTNARLGDVYFIGNEQLSGGLSSPRFDEQGAAATLYALASNQNCRFGVEAIPPQSLGLPEPLAQVLSDILSQDIRRQRLAGDKLVYQMAEMKHWRLPDLPLLEELNHLPIWIRTRELDIETVVYSSRKSFLRTHQGSQMALSGIKDAQLDKYYKNYLQGMGASEKAFVAAVSRLSEFPLVGGLAIHWLDTGLSVESNLNLFDDVYKASLIQTVDNIIDLARSLRVKQGTFKSCLFNAKNTLHLERLDEAANFKIDSATQIPFDIQAAPETELDKQHSYFEDGADPDEQLQLPEAIMAHIVALNEIRHTGCIIFEVLEKHMKIHNYFTLLDPDKYVEFKHHLAGILQNVDKINGLGVSGFMKLPYKDTRFFDYQQARMTCFYPTDPRSHLAQ